MIIIETFLPFVTISFLPFCFYALFFPPFSFFTTSSGYDGLSTVAVARVVFSPTVTFDVNLVPRTVCFFISGITSVFVHRR